MDEIVKTKKKLSPDHLAKLHKARQEAVERRAAQKAAEASVKQRNEKRETEGLAETTARTPARTSLRKNEALGRNGEVLTRKRNHSGDIFAIPMDLIPMGWEYQWCAVSVTGNTEILLDQNLMMSENGWRPVPSSRYEGKFMPAGHSGSIIRGGQMLMERPAILSQEAREEDQRNAKQLISDRNASLKLSGMRKEMTDGFEMGGKYRGTGGDIRMSIDKGLDIPAPQHKLADPGE